MANRPGGPSISRAVLVGAGLLVAAVLLLLAAPLGYRLGVVPLRFALLTLLAWGVYLAAGAAVVSALALILTLARPKERRRGLLLAAATLAVAVALIAVPARFRMGTPAPPIHDITTDTEDPPEYVAVLPLRADAPNTTDYGGEPVAAQQRQAYSDLQPAMLDVPPPQAFERALAAVEEMGWDLVAADPLAGRIEATDTTFWFGFKDDVVIRVRPAGSGSRVDVRSLSRVGVGDVGTNAKRIRAFLEVLTRQGRRSNL
jgi:uncharacterized protein (DUF1499 family)